MRRVPLAWDIMSPDQKGLTPYETRIRTSPAPSQVKMSLTDATSVSSDWTCEKG